MSRQPVLYKSLPDYEETIRDLDRWYLTHARAMPWRNSQDPWPVWVSETMLQQTRVETVLRFFEPFMQRFPTPEVMAGAGEEAVVSAWAGLGYYRRARLLYRGSVWVAEQLEGQIPTDVAQLLAIPGIGPYTAHAIASIAYGQARLPVDGNVARVVARLHLWPKAERVLPATEQEAWHKALKRSGATATRHAVQAMMEVGSRICIAKPRCEQCPVQRCATRLAMESGILDMREAPAIGRGQAKPAPVPESWRAVHLVWNNATLLTQRPAGLLGQQWALPVAPADQPWPAEPDSLATIQHIFTHRKWNVEVGRLDIRSSDERDVILSEMKVWLGDQPYEWSGQPEKRIVSRAFHKMLAANDSL